MALQTPLNKTDAIRRARHAVPQPMPVLVRPPQFTVRIPRDVREIDSELVEVTAKDYAEAQRIRSHAIARVALALMGLADVDLRLTEGGTIEQFMRKALERASHGSDTEPSLRFWQVQLACAQSDDESSTTKSNG